MSNYIILSMELGTIKDFLDRNLKECYREATRIDKKNENGKFRTLCEYEAAISMPFCRQEMAIRAVFYEINVLVEHELQQSAHKPWLESPEYKGKDHLLNPYHITHGYITREDIKKLRMVSDAKVRVKKLIEEYYKIKVDKLPGAKTILMVRKAVNSFKHRKGFADVGKLESKKINLLRFYKPRAKTAYRAIKQAEMFIKALWDKTGRTPKPISKDYLEWLSETDSDD